MHAGSGTSRHDPLRAARSDGGFTLVELVAVIVIVGVIGAVAFQVFRDLRYDARRAALEGIRATIVANTNLARSAWLGQGGGGTVTLNGRPVPVFPADTPTAAWQAPAGAPTIAGMFAMLGCGTAPPVATYTELRCPALPGYLVLVQDHYLMVWLEAASSSWSTANCSVTYWPAAGHDPAITLGVTAGDPYYTAHAYSESYFYPAADAPGGC
jgi:prepilin-type N-terminal cleavage/methylation domain-containing protein